MRDDIKLFGWTDEDVERLKDLWSRGFSTDAIAKQFGYGLTRSAVCGKAHRLGLPTRNGRLRGTYLGAPKGSTGGHQGNLASTALIRLPRRKGGAPRPVSAKAPAPPKLKPVPVPVAPLIAEPAPTCEPIGIMDLTNMTCRWPIGDGPFMFCGSREANEMAGRPYCPYHTRLAYVPGTSFQALRKARAANG